MSVLLEALKKAAEDKKNKAADARAKSESNQKLEMDEGRGAKGSSLGFNKNNSSDNSETTPPKSANTMDVQSEQAEQVAADKSASVAEPIKKPALALKLSPKAPEMERPEEIIQDSDEQVVKRVEPEVQLSADDVDFDLSHGRKPSENVDAQDSGLALSKDLSIENDPSPELKQLSHFHVEHKAQKMAPEDEDSLAAATLSFEQEVLSARPASDKKPETSIYPDYNTTSSEQSLTTSQSVDKSNISSQSSSEKQTTQKLDTDVEFTDEPTTAGLNTKHQTDEVTSTENKKNHDSESALEVDESYNFSIENLPGYQGNSVMEDRKGAQEDTVSSEPNVSKNPILIKGKNRSVSSIKPLKLNSKFVVVLVFLGLLIGILFYSLLYFQKQSNALEQSLVKYNIERVELNKPLPNQLPSNQSPNNQMADDTKQDKTELETILPGQKANIEEKLDPKRSVQNGQVVELKVGDRNTSEVKTQITTQTATKKIEPIFLEDKPASSVESLQTKEPEETSDRRNPVAKSSSGISQSKPRVEIDRTSGLSLEKQKLRDAYAAYQLQDWSLAEEKFIKVLSLNDQNIKAILGLAGSLLNQNKLKPALDSYQQALIISPKNLFAIEGIASIMQQYPMVDKSWQQTLEQVIEDFPESSVLLSAMGTVFAKQKKWHQAQEYYFKALAIDPANAQYNYNLAISLDHLKQYSSAIEYYTKALLYKTEQTPFNEPQVKQRLAALRLYQVKAKGGY